MATTYSTTVYVNRIPPGTGHGVFATSTHLHAVSPGIATWAASDVINVGFLPANAVVVGATLKAASQLDSNATPTLTLSLGVTGVAGLFKSAITTVGRAAGASVDTGLSAAGALYKNLSGGRQLVIVTVGAAAATAVAGTLEIDLEYYVEDAAGSAP